MKRGESNDKSSEASWRLLGNTALDRGGQIQRWTEEDKYSAGQRRTNTVLDRGGQLKRYDFPLSKDGCPLVSERGTGVTSGQLESVAVARSHKMMPDATIYI